MKNNRRRNNLRCYVSLHAFATLNPLSNHFPVLGLLRSSLRRRRKQILETLENGKDSVRDGSKTQFEQILDACALLGKACSLVGAKKDAEAFYRRAREGYVNLHGEDSEKALYATLSLFMSLGVKNGADIEVRTERGERSDEEIEQER